MVDEPEAAKPPKAAKDTAPAKGKTAAKGKADAKTGFSRPSLLYQGCAFLAARSRRRFATTVWAARFQFCKCI